MSYVAPDGPSPNPYMLIGEAPGYEEQIAGRGFVGKAGQQLWSEFARLGIPPRAKWYVSNIVKDGLPNNRDPKPAEISAATPIVLDELLAVQPRLVVTAGAFATRFFLGDVPMAHAHGILHETVIEGRAYSVLPIYHPAAGLHQKGYLAAFSYDLGRLGHVLSGWPEPWRPGQPVVCSWLHGQISGVGLPSYAVVVALDTEGWPDKPWGLSFTMDGRQAFVVPYKPESVWYQALRRWLPRQTIVMHNGLHDLPVLRAMGIEIGAYDDTQVLAYHEMLETGSGVLEAESQNLGTLAYRCCGMRLGELKDLPGVDFERQEIPYSEAVKQYAGEDAIATWRLFERLRPYTKRQPYQIDMGQVPLVAEMIAHGMPFDLTRTEHYYETVVKKEFLARAELQRVAGEYGLHNFNPGSHPQVRELLTEKLRLRIRKRTKGGKASTSEKAIAVHAGDPTVQLVQTYRELDKLRGTYLAPLLEELR